MALKRSLFGFAALALALGACAPEPQDSAREISSAAGALCSATQARADFRKNAGREHGFSRRLTQACRSAQARILSDDPITQWMAHEILKDLVVHTQALIDMGSVASDSGEYLIAKQTGLTKTLATWSARFPQDCSA